MGDGTRSGKGITLQTQSFTVKEVVYIISILIYNFKMLSPYAKKAAGTTNY
jgi:hypothetical protein